MSQPNMTVGPNRNIWRQISEHGSSKIKPEFANIEELFCQQEKKAKDAADGAKKKKKSAEINLLDGKRSLNVNIFLKQFRMPNDAIMTLIKEGNVEGFGGVERLRGLMKLLPEKDELGMLKAFTGDQTKLGAAEKFYLQLSELPNYALRIEGMMMKEEHAAAIAYLTPAINITAQASQDILQSKMLEEFLALILVTGNYINAGGYAGNAIAFKISSLLKLQDTRANKPRMTLMHYLVEMVAEKDPELLTFPDEMKNLPQACRLSVDHLTSEVNQLRKSLSKVQKQVDSASDDIKEQLMKFLKVAKEEVGELEAGLAKIETLSTELAAYFCEDGATFKLQEFLQIFDTFIKRIKQCQDDNEKRKISEKKAEQRKKQREEMEKKKAARVAAGGVASVGLRAPEEEEDGCLIDNLLKDIRKGFVLKKNKMSADEPSPGQSPIKGKRRSIRLRSTSSSISALSRRGSRSKQEDETSTSDSIRMPSVASIKEEGGGKGKGGQDVVDGGNLSEGKKSRSDAGEGAVKAGKTIAEKQTDGNVGVEAGEDTKIQGNNKEIKKAETLSNGAVSSGSEAKEGSSGVCSPDMHGVTGSYMIEGGEGDVSRPPLVEAMVIDEKQNTRPVSMSAGSVKASMSSGKDVSDGMASTASDVTSLSMDESCASTPAVSRREDEAGDGAADEKSDDMLGEIDALCLQVDEDIRQMKRRSFIDESSGGSGSNGPVVFGNGSDAHDVKVNDTHEGEALNGHHLEESGGSVSPSVQRIKVPGAPQGMKTSPAEKKGSIGSWVSDIRNSLRGKKASTSSLQTEDILEEPRMSENIGSDGEVNSVNSSPSKESWSKNSKGREGDDELDLMIEEMEEFINVSYDTDLNSNNSNNTPRCSFDTDVPEDVALEIDNKGSILEEEDDVFAPEVSQNQTVENDHTNQVPLPSDLDHEKSTAYCLTGNKVDEVKPNESLPHVDDKGPSLDVQLQQKNQEIDKGPKHTSATHSTQQELTEQKSTAALLKHPEQKYPEKTPVQQQSASSHEIRIDVSSSSPTPPRVNLYANEQDQHLSEASPERGDSNVATPKTVKRSRGARLYASVFKRNQSKGRKDPQAGSSGSSLMGSRSSNLGLGLSPPDLITTSEASMDSSMKKKKGGFFGSFLSRGKKSKKYSPENRATDSSGTFEHDEDDGITKEKKIGRFAKFRSSSKAKTKSL